MHDYLDFNKKLNELVSSAKSILITSHIDPDDDAMASVLAMYFILSQRYPDKKVRAVFSSQITKRWQYFENFEKIESAKDITGILGEFDAVVFLDANYAERFSHMPALLLKYGGKKICIDHHGSKPMSFDLSLVEPEATSTSELIYFSLLENESKLNPRLCELLLMGIMADTGGFQFVPPGQSRIFNMAKRLVDDGQIDINALRTKYSGISERVFEIFKELLKNAKLETAGKWPRLISSFVSGGFAKEYSHLEVDDAAAEFTRYLTSVDEAAWGMVARPSGERVKVSLRAKPGGVNVRIIAEAMGKGSGHDLAAGMKFDGTSDAEAVLAEVKEWLLKNNPE